MSHGKNRWSFGQVKLCPWSLKGDHAVKLLIYHNPEKGAPGDCTLQALQSAVGKRSQVFIGKKEN